MNNYAQARKSMVDSQLAPNAVIDARILNIFGTVPREAFVPAGKKGMAYLDEDLPLGAGAFLMEPLVHARMVQAANPGPNDSVLNIGDRTGYSSAVLSDLVSTVVTVEARAGGTLAGARQVWDDLGYCNIAVLTGKECVGCPEHGPYNLIFINGAVAEVPEALLSQLAPHGRLAAVVRPQPNAAGRITVIEKSGEGRCSTGRFQDAATPYVPGLEPADSFVF